MVLKKNDFQEIPKDFQEISKDFIKNDNLQNGNREEENG